MQNNKKEKRITIFLIHAEVDWKLASALQSCLAYALRIPEDSVYRTSDPTTIEFGRISAEEIIKAHKQSKAVISMMTPNSASKPWPLLEAGGAYFHPRKPLLVTVANGATIDSIPEALRRWHMGSLAKSEVIVHLCMSLAKILDCRFRRPTRDQVNSITSLAEQFSGNWKVVTPALVAAKLIDSPFMVLNLLDDRNPNAAKMEVFLTAPHLRGLTQPTSTFGGAQKIKKKIFKWLKANTARRFHVMISKIKLNGDKVPPGNKVWSEILENFENDLKASTEEFEKWEKEAEQVGLSFKLKCSNFVQFSATFVDPLEDSGMAMLRPYYWGAPPDMLPEIILSKERNKEVFDYYWMPFKTRYDKSDE
jgi:hypothetical protein